MSRSGYCEDYDEEFPNAGAFYRSSVERAIEGKRGQAFLRDLLKALDDMPVKRLIADDLVRDGEVCAIGALGKARGVDMQGIEPDNVYRIAGAFKVAEALAREVVFENDEKLEWSFRAHVEESPEDRWKRMREWVVQNLRWGAAHA